MNKLNPYEEWSLWNKLLYKKVVVATDESGRATKVLVKKRSKALLYLLIVVALVIIAMCVFITYPRKTNLSQLFNIIGEMFHPYLRFNTYDEYFNYMWTESVPLLIDTMAIVFVATIIGSVVSIPLFMISSKNTVKSPYIYQPVRFILDVIRSIPTFALAMITVAIVGYNNTAGIIAMIFFTAGVLYKMEYEFIDTRDMAPYEASLAVGAGRIQAFSTSLWPQIFPNFLSNIIYTYEISVRGSVVLGYVGAGGIGLALSEASTLMYWDEVGAIVIPIFVVTLVLQLISSYVRRITQ